MTAKNFYKNGHISELKTVISSMRLPEIVLGLILMEFKENKISTSEVFRRVGAKLSLNRKIIKVCLLILVEAGAIEFTLVCREPHIVLKR